MPVTLKPDERETIVKIMARLAATSSVAIAPQIFFRNLVQQTDLPETWKMELSGPLTGSPMIDARSMVVYALPRNIYADQAPYTTLGALLEPLLKDTAIDRDEARQLVTIIVAHRLYRTPQLLMELMERYKVPLPAAGTSAQLADISLALDGPGGAVGPAINWRGPDDQQLESLSWPVPNYLDVGFLMQAIDRAAAVCRVEIPGKQRMGTGFLIAPGLLITNYHVLQHPDVPGDDLHQNAKDVTLRFGFITNAKGESVVGHPFKLADDPIRAASPVAELDYVLLQVEESVKTADGIKPLFYQPPASSTDKALNIIQHPGGETLKLALSSNGLTGIYAETSRIQYVSRATLGSSGAPCFNGRWELVALHHAQVPKSSGSVREGILFSTIYEQIKDKLGH
jgi:V8-like Glu-specific endopeptidase